MFMAAISLIAQSGNNINVYQLMMLIKKMGSSHTMEHDSAIERNEVLTHAIHGCALKALCWVKEAGHKRPHITWFGFCKHSKQANPQI